MNKILFVFISLVTLLDYILRKLGTITYKIHIDPFAKMGIMIIKLEIQNLFSENSSSVI